MVRRIVETVIGFAVLAALALGLTALPSAQLSRISTVQSTRSAKVVCVPASIGATVFVDNAQAVGPLGWVPAEITQSVLKYQQEPIVAEGADGPRGGSLTSDGTLATLIPCMRPISEGVLAVPATADTELRIVNPDATEAAIDLTLYGTDGEIQSLGARGIALAPHEQRTIALSVLTAEATPVGVTVRASRGRAAVVAVTQTEQRASAIIPSTLGDQHWLAGVPAGAASASVVIANPSEERITADLTVYGTTPAYIPQGGSNVSVAPFSSVSVPLEASLAGEASAVNVRASAPVIAGLSFIQGDGAEVAPVQAATELAAFTATGGVLQLTNPGTSPATVTVTVAGPAGTDVAEVVEAVTVGAGQTLAHQLPADTPDGQRVLVSSNVDVFGAVVQAGDTGTWAAPLEIPGIAVPEPVAAELDPSLR